jgi:hypothetical protein
MKKVCGWIFIVVLALCAACGDDDNGTTDPDPCPNGQTRNPVNGECRNDSDAGTQDTSSEDAGTTDTGNTDSGNTDSGNTDTGTADTGQADASDQDATQTGGGILYGVVTRQASTQPEEDGVGHLYIAVFVDDPISNRNNNELVGFQRIEDADVSADTAEIPYRIEGIEPRDDPYYIAAFLDDDATADTSDPSSAGPDTGDLVAIEQAFPPASPTVTVDQATEVEFDILLNFNMI